MTNNFDITNVGYIGQPIVGHGSVINNIENNTVWLSQNFAVRGRIASPIRVSKVGGAVYLYGSVPFAFSYKSLGAFVTGADSSAFYISYIPSIDGGGGEVFVNDKKVF